jgi:signal peptidase I
MPRRFRHATLAGGVPILESMSFLTPPPSDDESARDGDTPSFTEWSTPPATDRTSGLTAVPYAPPLVDFEQFSHGGLTAVDPWADRERWYHVLWPWGLGGVIETLDVVVLALVMFLCVRFVAHNYIVDGASMVPTFEDSDFLIVNRLAYRSFDFSWVPGVDENEWRPFGTPRPGDVIVFAYQQSPTERDFIKRVIALPGQTVEVTGGVTYVDGVPLTEPYIAQAPAYTYPPTEVQPGTLFVLGDNRNNSFDSHSFGPIPADSVVGRADLRYWPFNRWGMIEHVIGDGDSLAGRLGRVGGGLAAAWR